MNPQTKHFRTTLRKEIWHRSRFGFVIVALLAILAVLTFTPESMQKNEVDYSYGAFAFLAILIAVTLTRRQNALRRLLRSLPCSPLDELHSRLQVGFIVSIPFFLLLLALSSLLTQFEAMQAAKWATCFFGMLFFMINLTTMMNHIYELLLFLMMAAWIEYLPLTLGFLLLALASYRLAAWRMPQIYHAPPDHHQFLKMLLSFWVAGSSSLLLLGEWSTRTEWWANSLIIFGITFPALLHFLILALIWKRRGWSEIPTKGVTISLGASFCALINGAFLVFCGISWFSPDVLPNTSPLAQSTPKYSFDDYLLTLILFLSALAPLFSGVWASDIAAGWSRQDSFLNRLPPRPYHVAGRRFRELFRGITLGALPIVILVGALGFYRGGPGVFILSALLFATSFINGIWSAAIIRLLKLWEFWPRTLVVGLIYIGSLVVSFSFGGSPTPVLVLLVFSLGVLYFAMIGSQGTWHLES